MRNLKLITLGSERVKMANREISSQGMDIIFRNYHSLACVVRPAFIFSQKMKAEMDRNNNTETPSPSTPPPPPPPPPPFPRVAVAVLVCLNFPPFPHFRRRLYVQNRATFYGTWSCSAVLMSRPVMSWIRWLYRRTTSSSSSISQPLGQREQDIGHYRSLL